jgi:hypothetical protein
MVGELGVGEPVGDQRQHLGLAWRRAVGEGSGGRRAAVARASTRWCCTAGSMAASPRTTASHGMGPQLGGQGERLRRAVRAVGRRAPEEVPTHG